MAIILNQIILPPRSIERRPSPPSNFIRSKRLAIARRDINEGSCPRRIHISIQKLVWRHSANACTTINLGHFGYPIIAKVDTRMASRIKRKIAF